MALAAIMLNVLEQTGGGGGGGTSTNSWLGVALVGMARHMIWLIVMMLLVTQSKG